MHIDIPKGAVRIISKLNEHGHEAYIVGGCVRDSLMHRHPSDWDICTSARAEDMLTIFKAKRIIPTGLQHGTITILETDGAYEVTTFRIDGEYLDHRRPESVAFTQSLAEDLSRRDFTINAMAWHPQKGLIDLFGGAQDLEQRIVRAVGEPMQRFNEDGLRLLRMVRFATVLDFDYDEATYDAVHKQNHLLKHISKERIQVELNKILLANHPARGIEDLYDLGLLSYIIPTLCHTVGFDQLGGHHFLDVFEHTILAVGVVEQELVLRLTMLLHDIGKPFTWNSQAEFGYDVFENHAAIGAQVADSILRDLKYDNRTRKDVVELIAHHNDILLPEEVNIRRHLSILGQTQVERLIRVKVADLIAHDFPNERQRFTVLFNRIRNVMNEISRRGDCTSIGDLAIRGGDLKALGFSGPDIGQKLQQALDYVIEHPEENKKEHLLKWLSEMG